MATFSLNFHHNQSIMKHFVNLKMNWMISSEKPWLLLLNDAFITEPLLVEMYYIQKLLCTNFHTDVVRVKSMLERQPTTYRVNVQSHNMNSNKKNHSPWIRIRTGNKSAKKHLSLHNKDQTHFTITIHVRNLRCMYVRNLLISHRALLPVRCRSRSMQAPRRPRGGMSWHISQHPGFILYFSGNLWPLWPMQG